METRDVVTMETSAENVEVVMATEDTAGAHALTAAVATSKDISKEDAPVTMSNEESGSEGQATDVAMTTTSRLQGAGVGLEFLREVHGYLGGAGQGWCVQDEGCLLKTMVGELRRELQTLTAHSHKTREVRSPDMPCWSVNLPFPFSLLRLCCEIWSSATTASTVTLTRRPRPVALHLYILMFVVVCVYFCACSLYCVCSAAGLGAAGPWSRTGTVYVSHQPILHSAIPIPAAADVGICPGPAGVLSPVLSPGSGGEQDANP